MITNIPRRGDLVYPLRNVAETAFPIARSQVTLARKGVVARGFILPECLEESRQRVCRFNVPARPRHELSYAVRWGIDCRESLLQNLHESQPFLVCGPSAVGIIEAIALLLKQVTLFLFRFALALFFFLPRAFRS